MLALFGYGKELGGGVNDRAHLGVRSGSDFGLRELENHTS